MKVKYKSEIIKFDEKIINYDIKIEERERERESCVERGCLLGYCHEKWQSGGK